MILIFFASGAHVGFSSEYAKRVSSSDRLPRAGLGECDRFFDFCRDLIFDPLHIRVIQNALGRQAILKGGDRIAFLPFLDFALVAIELRIVHRVRAEAISPEFEKAWTFAGTHRERGAMRCFLARDNVHSVDRPRRHFVCRRLETQIRLRLRSFQRRAHRIKVVLAAEQHRKFPERGEVHASRGTHLRPPPRRRRSTRSLASSRCILSASARPTASGNPPPTIALPP